MKWTLRSSGFRNTLLQAGSFDREVFLQAPPEWDPQGPRRVRDLEWILVARARFPGDGGLEISGFRF